MGIHGRNTKGIFVMEIAGYDVDTKYVIAGAAGLGILFLVSRGKGKADDNTFATLRPAEGLTWKDVIGESDPGKLIGPGGESGGAGLEGPPGPPGLPGVGFIGTSPVSGGGGGRNRNRGGGRDKNRGGGRHDDRQHTGRSNDGGGSGRRNKNAADEPLDTPNSRHANGRPRMPSVKDKSRRDPRLDDPRSAKRRNDGDNRVNRNRSHENAGGDRDTSGNDIRGNENIDVSGGHAKSRGKNANASAKGGSVSRGNIDKNAHVDINARGGTAHADASGGDGNSHDKKKAKQLRNRLTGGGRGGAAVDWSGIEDAGFGRQDGQGTDVTDDVSSQPFRGHTTGSFMPFPQPLSAIGERAAIQKGETLRGFSQRTLGSEHFWPRIVKLNNSYAWGDNEIPAGTVFRIG
jgi:hypothetical protein